jgi:hypothetical protein
MTQQSKCPWHLYIRVDEKGKFYITDVNGIEKTYGTKDELIATWSKKKLPNTGIVYTIIDESGKSKKGS